MSSSILLDFSGFTLRASGNVTLDIDGFASVSGNFAVEQGASHDITLSDGTSRHGTVLTIGASNANAFFGVNGPDAWASRSRRVVRDRARQARRRLAPAPLQ